MPAAAEPTSPMYRWIPCSIPVRAGFLLSMNLQMLSERGALPAAIPLNDGRFKRDALEARHMKRDISGGSGKVPVIVAAAVALAGLISFVAGSLG